MQLVFGRTPPLLSLYWYYAYYACAMPELCLYYASTMPTMPVLCLLCLYYACTMPTMPVLCLLCTICLYYLYYAYYACTMPTMPIYNHLLSHPFKFEQT